VARKKRITAFPYFLLKITTKKGFYHKEHKEDAEVHEDFKTVGF